MGNENEIIKFPQEDYPTSLPSFLGVSRVQLHLPCSEGEAAPGGSTTSIVRTALGTALRDRKMDDCVVRGLLQFIDKANCALGIVQALRGLLPRPSRPIRHRSTTFIAPPSTIHRALNCRIERTISPASGLCPIKRAAKFGEIKGK